MSYIIVGSQLNNRGRRSLQIVQLVQVMTQLAYSTVRTATMRVSLILHAVTDVCLSIYVSPDSHRSACGDSGLAYRVFCTKYSTDVLQADTRTPSFPPLSLNLGWNINYDFTIRG